MNTRDLTLQVADDCSHHITPDGVPVYAKRFDEVLKFHAPGLAPVSQNGEAWHIHPDSSPAYTHRFKRTFGYYEGFAAVIHADGWHHIFPTGVSAYKERYAWCGNFQNGRCTVRRFDDTYSHILPNGKPAYDAYWKYAGDYRDGIAVVQASDGRSSHIDLNGQFIHQHWFIDLDVFHKGFARAQDEEGWMHIDIHGHPIYSRRFATVEPFYNGQARVERFDGSLEVIDESGQTITELRPPRQSEFVQLSSDMVGFWRTQTIGTAVKLGLFERLPATTTEIANRCNMIPDHAKRLLYALGELQLVQLTNKQDKQQHEQWKLTPRGLFLQSKHPLTLADAALEYADSFSTLWRQLPEALQNPEWQAPEIFRQVAQDQTRCQSHHRMLKSYAQHDYASIVDVLDLQNINHVIDAGGGLGTLAALVLKKYPSLSVTVLDLPEVTELGQQQLKISGLHWHPANIFEPWKIEANAILLARVLHDWDDEKAAQILRQARNVLPTGGRIFIIEMLLSEQRIAGALSDLHLLIATGGQERACKDFEALLHQTGFKLEAVRTANALPSILVGIAV